MLGSFAKTLVASPMFRRLASTASILNRSLTKDSRGKIFGVGFYFSILSIISFKYKRGILSGWSLFIQDVVKKI
jgi:hypothetical protein